MNANQEYAIIGGAGGSDQTTTMPTPSAENLGTIVQYVGDTNQYYTNGYFYKVVSNGEVPPTYSREQVDTQPASSGEEHEFITQADYDTLTPAQKAEKVYMITGEGSDPTDVSEQGRMFMSGNVLLTGDTNSNTFTKNSLTGASYQEGLFIERLVGYSSKCAVTTSSGIQKLRTPTIDTVIEGGIIDSDGLFLIVSGNPSGVMSYDITTGVKTTIPVQADGIFKYGDGLLIKIGNNYKTYNKDLEETGDINIPSGDLKFVYNDRLFYVESNELIEKNISGSVIKNYGEVPSNISLYNGFVYTMKIGIGFPLFKL